MLDGLDEGPTARRGACIEAINNFLATVGVPGIAVSSWPGEYSAMPARLSLNAAVRIAPLSKVKVDGYLARAGGHATQASIKQIIANDPTLQAQAISPLMLNIMHAVISSENQDTAGDAAPEAENQRLSLYDTYIRSRLKGSAGGYRENRVRQWLTWLATAMSAHKET